MHRIPLAALLGALAAAPAARGFRLPQEEAFPSVWTSVAGNASEEARWRQRRAVAAPAEGELLRLWDGRLAMLDEAAPAEVVSPEVNLRQSVDYVPWQPALPPKRRWAVCITGQLSRLEIESKVANLLTELKRESDVVDVYLVLDLKVNVFVNKDTDYGGNSSCQSDPFSVQELRKRLAPWYKAGLFVKHEDWSKQLQMKRWPWYGVEKRIDRRQRLASHFSQWTHIAACAELVKSKEPRPMYSDILRVREDAIITLPFQASNINKDMGIAVKSTQSWGGLNDKAMYASRNYLSSAFQRTLQLAWGVNTGQLPPAVAQVMPKIINPERMLALALRGLPVTQLPAEVMVMVDGRCHGPGRRFCLVPKHKDARPANRTLFAPACTLEVEGLAERLHGNRTKRAADNASAAGVGNATEAEVSEEEEEESPEGEQGGEDAPNMF